MTVSGECNRQEKRQGLPDLREIRHINKPWSISTSPPTCPGPEFSPGVVTVPFQSEQSEKESHNCQKLWGILPSWATFRDGPYLSVSLKGEGCKNILSRLEKVRHTMITTYMKMMQKPSNSLDGTYQKQKVKNVCWVEFKKYALLNANRSLKHTSVTIVCHFQLYWPTHGS